MKTELTWIRYPLVLGIIISGLLPVLLYWWHWDRVPTLAAPAAIERLCAPDDNPVLVDVREPRAFAARHVQAALNWPLVQIKALDGPDQVPGAFRERTLLLMCEHGYASAVAARYLRKIGHENVYNVRGGVQEWIKVAETRCGTMFANFASGSGQTEAFPFREMAGYEQWAAVIAAFGFKPMYMLLSLVLILVLARTRATDLVALRWGLISFLLGESFCAANYLFSGEDSYLLEYLHSYGMVLALGFTAFSLMEGLDLRVIRFSDPTKRCSANELCGACIKFTDVPCGARRILLTLIPLLAVLCLLALLAQIQGISYNASILGADYNYSHSVISQLFENRYCPLLAVGLYASAFVTLFILRDRPVPRITKILLSAGLGFFALGLLRLILVSVYRDNLVWYVFWEELTELMYVVAAGATLWIFRRQLLRQ
jgi:rhodanese-related sulfurtransferase